jgi:hypothetical protein
LSIKASAPYSRRQRPATKAEALKRKLSQLKFISAMGFHVGGPERYSAADFPSIIVVEGSFLVELKVISFPPHPSSAMSSCNSGARSVYFDGSNVPPLLLLALSPANIVKVCVSDIIQTLHFYGAKKDGTNVFPLIA